MFLVVFFARVCMCHLHFMIVCLFVHLSVTDSLCLFSVFWKNNKCLRRWCHWICNCKLLHKNRTCYREKNNKNNSDIDIHSCCLAGLEVWFTGIYKWDGLWSSGWIGGVFLCVLFKLLTSVVGALNCALYDISETLVWITWTCALA